MAGGGEALKGFGLGRHVGGQVGTGEIFPEKGCQINDMGAVYGQF